MRIGLRAARRTRAALFALLLCAAAGDALGQRLPDLPEGTRIRLLAVGGYRADGVLLALTPDSIVLRADPAGRLGLALGAVRRLEARLPTGSAWRAARRGVLAGAAVAIVTTGAMAVLNDGSLDATFAVPFLLGTTAAGGVAGAVFLRGYAWRVISLPGH